MTSILDILNLGCLWDIEVEKYHFDSWKSGVGR